jgi:Flp pilus assembly protein TadD
VELKRLLGVRRAYLCRIVAETAFARREIEEGNREYRKAQALMGDNPEMRFWHAIALVNAERVEDALALFREVFAKDQRWLELAERLAAIGRLPADSSLMTKIRSALR